MHSPPGLLIGTLLSVFFASGAHGNNLIAVLAKYIYHRHDPALPRLAIQLLKRLATVGPMEPAEYWDVDTPWCSLALLLIVLNVEPKPLYMLGKHAAT